ncbi:MAG: two-component system LytT family response regulator [Glaciecola sp.]|jgi:two-component system LytT family response regulator
MINTLIVDDERLARVELTQLLKAYPQINVIGEATNGNEAVEKIESLKPDLVFLDIEMPGKTGFEVLENLSVVPQIIFVTAFDEFAIKAFESNALDYVLKPIVTDRLEKAINKVEDNKMKASDEKLNRDSQIFIKDGEKCWFVKLEKVRLFESEGNYVRLYFDENKPLILKSLNNLELRLNDKQFFRVSRKHIINLACIAKVDPWFSNGLRVTLNTGEHIEISRRQSSRFKEVMAL